MFAVASRWRCSCCFCRKNATPPATAASPASPPIVGAMNGVKSGPGAGPGAGPGTGIVPEVVGAGECAGPGAGAGAIDEPEGQRKARIRRRALDMSERRIGSINNSITIK